MPEADQLLRAGDLDGARSALVEVVRKEPANEQARMFLFQLLALTGDWDKARKHLDILAQLSGEAQMLAAAYGQAIVAEAEREAVFAGKARARQHVASDWAEGILDAIELLAKGEAAAAVEARDAAFDQAPDTPGAVDGERFDWLANADARFGPSFEAIIGGRYGLQPFDQVARIESEGPVDLRDLVWYPVQIAFKSGQSVAAFLPARYPGTGSGASADELLARTTSWSESPIGEVGRGQQLWTPSSGEDHGLLGIRNVTFD